MCHSANMAGQEAISLLHAERAAHAAQVAQLMGGCVERKAMCGRLYAELVRKESEHVYPIAEYRQRM